MADVLKTNRPVTVYAHPAAFAPKYARNGNGSVREIGMPYPAEKAIRQPQNQFVSTEQPTTIFEGLMATVKQLGITELTIRRSDVAFTLRGEGSAPAAAAPAAPIAETAPVETPAPAPAPAPAADAKLATIDAPLTGTFYRSSGLNKPNFVEEGGSLKGGEPICIIEAMKLFNQIKVEKPCKVVKFLVKHGSVVQKGTPLAQVEY